MRVWRLRARYWVNLAGSLGAICLAAFSYANGVAPPRQGAVVQQPVARQSVPPQQQQPVVHHHVIVQYPPRQPQSQAAPPAVPPVQPGLQAMPAGQVPGPGSIPGDSVEGDIAEIQRAHQQDAENAQKLNQMNPMMNGLAPFAAQAGAAFNPNGMSLNGTTGGAPGNPQLAMLMKIVNHPFFQSLMKYMSDPAVTKLMTDMAESPQRQNLLYAELGWIIAYMVIRFLISLKMLSSRIILRIIVRVFTWLLFVGVSSFLIPIYCLGDPYLKYLQGLYERVILPNLH